MPKKGAGLKAAGLKDLHRNIIQRTTNPMAKSYEDYGFKFLKMEPWLRNQLNFKRYILYVLGPKPGPEWSLDRIDPDYGYVRNNLRWATPEMQNRNRLRTDSVVNGFYEFPWGTVTANEAAKELGVSEAALRWHRKRGKSPEDIIKYYQSTVPSKTGQGPRRRMLNAEAFKH